MFTLFWDFLNPEEWNAHNAHTITIPYQLPAKHPSTIPAASGPLLASVDQHHMVHPFFAPIYPITSHLHKHTKVTHT